MLTRCAGTALLLGLGATQAGSAGAQPDTSNTAARPPQPGNSIMQSQQEIAAALMRISDQELLRTPLAGLPALGYQALTGQRFEGLALRAPAQVDTDASHALPLLVTIGQGSERARQVPLQRNAFVFVTRLGRGDSWATRAFSTPEGKILGPASKRPAPPPPDKSISVLGVEARDMLRLGMLPREAGRYAVRMIAWDWVSNTVSVTLTGARADGAPQTQAPATQWLTTYRHSLEPAPGPVGLEDSRPSLTLMVTRDTTHTDAPLVANGSVRVPHDAEWPRSASGLSAVPAHLLFVRPDVVQPVVLALLLAPPRGPTTSGMVEAYFSVELDRQHGMPVSAYQGYLVVGDQISAAAPFEMTR
ncbi:hypothetical protein GTP81_24465 [Rugamonas sp. FT107W]|uniref:Uncharacterized protein n=1 Tax=Duganella vulcania TaxID=2692166 RepID=A0A845HSR2_9BURK|nr:hypothetical protein [Duganella vulcania]MYN19904.1 hypothetical protein [Duganella vulcania]